MTTTTYNQVHKPIRTSINDPTLYAGQRVSLTWYDHLYRVTVSGAINDTVTPAQANALRGGFWNDGSTAPVIAFDHRTVRTVYDLAGNKRFSFDPQGRRSEMRYDRVGRLVQTLAPQVPDASLPGAPLRTPTSGVTYDAADHPLVSTDPRGLQVKSEYDARYRVVRSIRDLDGDGLFETNGDDLVSASRYDHAGQAVQQVDARGAVTDFTYDAAGRVVRMESPAVADAEQGGTLARPLTQTRYDANGNAILVIDPRGVRTQTESDAYNRPLAVFAALATADEVQTSSAYDAHGNVLSLTLHNRMGGQSRPQVTTYAYDAFDRKLSETLPSVSDGINRQVTLTYATTGEALTRTDAKGQITRTRYDGFGQALSTTVQVAAIYEQQRWMTYTPSGKLKEVGETELRASQPYAQTTRYHYDLLDRLTLEQHATPEQSEAVASGYDLDGNRVVQRVEPGTATARLVTSIFDRANRVRTITDGGYAVGGGESIYTYDANGNRLSLSRPGGLTDAYVYDALNRVTMATTSGAQGEVYRVGYAYDLVGNRRQADETLAHQGALTTTYGYDAQYRLRRESTPTSVTTYSYDPAGNRERMEVASLGGNDPQTVTTTISSHDDLNRLLARTTTWLVGLTPASTVTVSYAYDRNGSRIAETRSGTPERRLRWDAFDRLIGVDEVDANGQREIFSTRYDARTRRREVTEAGKTTFYRYDGGDCYRETTQAGAATVEFVRGSGMGGGIGSILYSDRRAASGPVESFAYNPAVGHTVATIAADGATVSTNRYEAFGNIHGSTGDSKNNRLANTKERSAVLGLDNHGFRYYDPAIGRYISKDPIGFGSGTMNHYAYTDNNPINRFDPLGLTYEV